VCNLDAAEKELPPCNQLVNIIANADMIHARGVCRLRQRRERRNRD
jgi:hypothetical protein